jgi:hypothetical protein
MWDSFTRIQPNIQNKWTNCTSKTQWKIFKAYYKPKRNLPIQKNKTNLGRSSYLNQEWVGGKDLVTPNYTIPNQRVTLLGRL